MKYLYHYYSKAFKARDLKGEEIVSQIYFDKYYILVIPSYTSTNVHKHSMQHLFWGKEKLTIDIEGQQYEGNIIFVKENVLHTMPVGAQNGFLLIDPTSYLAEQIREKYLKDKAGCGLELDESLFEQRQNKKQEIEKLFFGLLRLLSLEAGEHKIFDRRIEELHNEIKNDIYLGKRVSQIAVQKNYSESWLTHLFKQETGVSLKTYLLTKQMEYVWKKVKAGVPITTAALDAGYSSSSHFAATCKKLLGISISDTMKKADF